MARKVGGRQRISPGSRQRTKLGSTAAAASFEAYASNSSASQRLMETAHCALSVQVQPFRHNQNSLRDPFGGATTLYHVARARSRLGSDQHSCPPPASQCRMLRESGLDVRIRTVATPPKYYASQISIKSLLKFSIDAHKPCPFSPLLDLSGRDPAFSKFTDAPASRRTPEIVNVLN